MWVYYAKPVTKALSKQWKRAVFFFNFRELKAFTICWLFFGILET